MLRDAAERAIMADALQAGLRRSKPPTLLFSRIIHDFGVPRVDGARVLDMGPGQLDLGEVLTEAVIVGIDNDPAVIALGRRRAYEMIELDLLDAAASTLGQFDGLFCRGSINAFWFRNQDAAHTEWITRVCGLLRPGGWGWIAPWNHPKYDPPHREAESPEWLQPTLQTQIDAFAANGWEVVDLGEGNDYTSSSAVNNVVFTYGLVPPT